MTPDLARLERGWNLIAEGAQEIALAYAAASNQSGGRRGHAPPDDLPPLEDTGSDQFASQLADRVGGEVVRPDTALGRCPVHEKAWTVKPGGISKNGKPYRSFWKCSERDADGYCNEKPIPAWANSHPPDRELVPA